MRFWVFALLIALGASPALAQVDNQWLNRMSTALSSTPYKAHLFHQQGDNIVSIKAVQLVSGDQHLQSVERLDGPAQPLVATRSNEHCGMASSALGSLDPSLINTTYYDVVDAPAVRVAGRDAARVQVVAKDPLRYSYLLDIDKQSGLPLRYVIVGANRVPLERLQVVSLTLQASKFEQELSSHTIVEQQCDRQLEVDGRWSMSVPPGFSLKGSHIEQGKQRLTYSDGLASYSLYIEEGAQQSTLASRGALNAIVESRSFEGSPYTLTLMGDLPKATLDRIVQSVRLTGQ